MTKKEKPKTKPFLKLYIKDQETRKAFEILRDKWHMEGKIKEPTMSAAFAYMVTHIGRLETGAGNGSVHLDAPRRQKVNLLSRLLHLGGLIPDESDASVVNYTIDYTWNVHKSEQVIERILGDKKGA